jgi:hypothetical protein
LPAGFICERFLNTRASPGRSNSATHSSATPPAVSWPRSITTIEQGLKGEALAIFTSLRRTSVIGTLGV